MKASDLVETSLKQNKSLDDLLTKNSFSYEDLTYNTCLDIRLESSCYKKLSDFKKSKNSIPVVSFFSGCGGLDLGFEAAGFDHFAAVESVEIFCNTLRRNRDWNVIGPPLSDGDISNPKEIIKELDNLGLTIDFNGVFIGGPPCQPFSIAANQRFSKKGENFKRQGFDNEKNGNLLFKYVELIQHYKPKAFLIENVFGLMELDEGKQLQKVYESLEQSGYNIHEPIKIDASNYSVPQRRERLFIIGFRGNKNYIPPTPAKNLVPCIAALTKIPPHIENHITRKHKPESVKRYMELDFGKRDKKGRVDRLDPRLPSKTVIAGGSSGGGRSHLHPFIPRTLSVRESARLQTFPDNYIFTGSSARQFTQVGNAVPPVLAAQLANSMYESFFK